MLSLDTSKKAYAQFLWISIILGTVACIVSIIGSLVYSLIPQQIDNNHWWIIVGGITVACLVVAAMGSMLASSEVGWEGLKEAMTQPQER